MKRTLLAIILLAITVTLFGCNTIGGLGGDLRWTGEQIQNGAGNFTK
jgi:predicted small secreted protein